MADERGKEMPQKTKGGKLLKIEKKKHGGGGKRDSGRFRGVENTKWGDDHLLCRVGK